jgi:hypothetical protein
MTRLRNQQIFTPKHLKFQKHSSNEHEAQTISPEKTIQPQILAAKWRSIHLTGVINGALAKEKNLRDWLRNSIDWCFDGA